YGTANGRLHFHAVHFMRTLPTGSVDPNFGRRVRNRRQLNSLQNTWPYGYSMPIAVRYTQDSSVDKQASHFVHIPGLSYSGVKSPTECQQSLFESHFASRQSLSDCPVAF